VGRLELISKGEDLQVDNEALLTVVQTSGGDLRRAITCLQSCARLKEQAPITSDDILELMGVRTRQKSTQLLLSKNP
jgi:replication factor C subunit 2/4